MAFNSAGSDQALRSPEDGCLEPDAKLPSTYCGSSDHHSLVGEIQQLWQSGPGSIKASPSSFINEDSKVQRRQTLTLRFWVCCMVLTGGGVDFLVGLFDEIGQRRGYGGDAAVFVVTAFSFLATAIPPSLKSDNWSSLSGASRANPHFKYKLLVPGLADLAITSMRFAAILFVPPSVVSMLKTSTQLITLTFIQHFRGKRVNRKSGACIFFCLVGQIVVTYSEMLREEAADAADGPAFTRMFGLALAAASGLLGAVRNVAEEMILQVDDLSAGALLASESWISLLGLLVVNLGWKALHGGLVAFMAAVADVLLVPTTVPLLLAIMLCTYGKDFGKLFVVKHGSALIAKVLSMLFPIVTWAMTLCTFFASDGAFGEGLHWPSSAVRLAGFVVVAIASSTYVVAQTKKK